MTLRELFDKFVALGWFVSLNEQYSAEGVRCVLTLIHSDMNAPLVAEGPTPEAAIVNLLATIDRTANALQALCKTLE